MRPAASPMRPAATPTPLYVHRQHVRPASLSSADALLIIAEARKQMPNIALLIPHVSILSAHIVPLISHAKDGFIERATEPRMIQKLQECYTLMLEFNQ